MHVLKKTHSACSVRYVSRQSSTLPSMRQRSLASPATPRSSGRYRESERPMQALFISQKLGLVKYIIPELEEGIGCAQNQAHSYDVFEHLLRALQHAADEEW